MAGSNISWIYPDLKTVLTGKFKDGEMVEGRESKIIAERCNNGIKEVQIAPTKQDAPVFKYQPPSSFRVCHGEKLMDPYERKTVYINDSAYVGDGVFAKRNISPGEIVAYYVGTFNHINTLKNITYGDL